MRILIAIVLSLLTLPAVARPPAEVVQTLYDTHVATGDQRKTVQLLAHCFTPGFLGILERALKRQPPNPFVDVDIFANNQMGLGFFEVGKATVKGKEATVPVDLWIGRVNPANRFDRKLLTRIQVTVFLTDVEEGQGFQIRDLEFLPTQHNPKPFRIREWLLPIAEGRR